MSQIYRFLITNTYLLLLISSFSVIYTFRIWKTTCRKTHKLNLLIIGCSAEDTVCVTQPWYPKHERCNVKLLIQPGRHYYAPSGRVWHLVGDDSRVYSCCSALCSETDSLRFIQASVSSNCHQHYCWRWQSAFGDSSAFNHKSESCLSLISLFYTQKPCPKFRCV